MPHTALSLQASFGYLFVSEVHALKQLAQSLPANPVVCNIGAGSGTSGLAFMESRPDLFLYTVDIQKENSPFGCLYAEEQVLRQAGYIIDSPFFLNRYQPIHGDSKEIGKQGFSVGYLYPQDTGVVTWDKLFFDMVFVDGDHSYNGAKGDILAWLPSIKPGGIMAVHDFNKREVYKDGPIEGAPHPLPWPGVDRAVRKFLCPRYEIILQVATLIAFRIE